MVRKLSGYWALADEPGLFQPLPIGLGEIWLLFLLHWPIISFVKMFLTLRNFLEAPGGRGAAICLLLPMLYEPRKCYLSALVTTLNRLYEVLVLPLLPNDAVWSPAAAAIPLATS